MNLNLESKVILIAGGGTGIGKATAICLAQEGAKVAIGDLNISAAKEAAQTINDAGGEAIAISYDQADQQSIVSMVESVVSHYGKLNGLHANAAHVAMIMKDDSMLTLNESIWESTLSVNLVGIGYLIKECLPHFLKQSCGSIVCTSSAYASLGADDHPAYAASKAGVNALCRHVSSRWGKEGIRCNAVAPGIMITEKAAEYVTEEFFKEHIKTNQSYRLGRAEDIANAVAFLMSDENEYVNGQVWHVNGGMHYAN